MLSCVLGFATAAATAGALSAAPPSSKSGPPASDAGAAAATPDVLNQQQAWALLAQATAVYRGVHSLSGTAHVREERPQNSNPRFGSTVRTRHIHFALQAPDRAAFDNQQDEPNSSLPHADIYHTRDQSVFAVGVQKHLDMHWTTGAHPQPKGYFFTESYTPSAAGIRRGGDSFSPQRSMLLGVLSRYIGPAERLLSGEGWPQGRIVGGPASASGARPFFEPVIAYVDRAAAGGNPAWDCVVLKETRPSLEAMRAAMVRAEKSRNGAHAGGKSAAAAPPPISSARIASYPDQTSVTYLFLGKTDHQLHRVLRETTEERTMWVPDPHTGRPTAHQDSVPQKYTVDFSDLKINPTLPASTFQLSPPSISDAAAASSGAHAPRPSH